MTDTKTQPNQTLVISSQPASINLVEKLVDDLRASLDLNEDMYGNMLVALTEAVTNAIYHGNKSDAGKMIHVKYAMTTEQITFSVTDEGPGFDFYDLPDPTAPENLEKPSGRGIFLMKHLADQIIFGDNGRTVEIIFNIHHS